jgi:hypothetical protein
MRGRNFITLAAAFLVMMGLLPPAVAGTVLITDQEAMLPLDKRIVGTRGITRGQESNLPIMMYWLFRPCIFR